MKATGEEESESLELDGSNWPDVADGATEVPSSQPGDDEGGGGGAGVASRQVAEGAIESGCTEAGVHVAFTGGMLGITGGSSTGGKTGSLRTGDISSAGMLGTGSIDGGAPTPSADARLGMNVGCSTGGGGGGSGSRVGGAQVSCTGWTLGGATGSSTGGGGGGGSGSRVGGVQVSWTGWTLDSPAGSSTDGRGGGSGCTVGGVQVSCTGWTLGGTTGSSTGGGGGRSGCTVGGVQVSCTGWTLGSPAGSSTSGGASELSGSVGSLSPVLSVGDADESAEPPSCRSSSKLEGPLSSCRRNAPPLPFSRAGFGGVSCAESAPGWAASPPPPELNRNGEALPFLAAKGGDWAAALSDFGGDAGVSFALGGGAGFAPDSGVAGVIFGDGSTVFAGVPDDIRLLGGGGAGFGGGGAAGLIVGGGSTGSTGVSVGSPGGKLAGESSSGSGCTSTSGSIGIGGGGAGVGAGLKMDAKRWVTGLLGASRFTLRKRSAARVGRSGSGSSRTISIAFPYSVTAAWASPLSSHTWPSISKKGRHRGAAVRYSRRTASANRWSRRCVAS